MIITSLLSILLMFAPASQVTFELMNDSNDAMMLQISEVHTLTIPSESTSEVRLRVGEEIYLLEENVSDEDRLLLLIVDEEISGKSLKLTKLVKSARKMHKF